jgi:hypothetical protein
MADDTEYVQNLMNSDQTLVRFENREYNINVEKGIKIPSGKVIHLNGTFRAIPTSRQYSRIFRLDNCSDTKILGRYTLVGDRETHLAKTGEWGFGFEIRFSKNIRISSGEIRDFWGDGIYISDKSENISLLNLSCVHNRRQGITITSGTNISIRSCTFLNTTGVDPAAGIDLEPNKGEAVLKCFIQNCLFDGNTRGIQVGPANKDVGYSSVDEVEINQNRFRSNNPERRPLATLSVSNSGKIKILRNNFIGNAGNGIVVLNSDKVSLENNYITKQETSKDGKGHCLIIADSKNVTQVTNVLRSNNVKDILTI